MKMSRRVKLFWASLIEMERKMTSGYTNCPNAILSSCTWFSSGTTITFDLKNVNRFKEIFSPKQKKKRRRKRERKTQN